MTDPTLECKPTPHPDAVASGTCPSPSSDGLLDDVLGDGGQPTAGDGDGGQPTAASSSAAPTEPQATTQAPEPDQAATLPITGFSATTGIVLGLALMIVGVVLMWVRHRRARL